MLEAAVKNEHSSMITYLLTVFPTARINEPVLVASLTYRNIPIFNLPLTHDRTIVNQKLHTGATPLSSAVWDSSPDLALFLLSEGADPNLGGFGPPSTLCIAVREQPLEVIQSLIDRGAKIHRSFALQSTASAGRTDVVGCLLDAGADVNDIGSGNCAGRFNCTALHYAVENGHVDVATLLLDRGADVHSKHGSKGTVLEKAKMKKNYEMIGKGSCTTIFLVEASGLGEGAHRSAIKPYEFHPPCSYLFRLFTFVRLPISVAYWQISRKTNTRLYSRVTKLQRSLPRQSINGCLRLSSPI